MQASAKPAVFVLTTSYHPFIGGAEIAIQEVTRRLKGDFDFFIFTARFRPDLPRRETRDEGAVIRVGVGGGFDKWLFLIGAVFAALGERRRLGSRPVLLWGMDISVGSGVGAILNFLMPKLPFVLTVEYGYGDERIERGRFGLINKGLRFMLWRASAVTAISTYLADTARRYGYQQAVEVIPNGVSVEQFQAAARRRRNKSGATVITVSRLVSKNGVDTLIRAMAEVKEAVPGVRCHIIGDGPERRSLESLARELGVVTAVKFFGSVPYEELPRYLAQADVFARPSRSEGMGNAFVEALAAGLPIIGTAVGGIPDIIRDGETGLFARVDDPDDLAAKVKRLLSDHELAERMVRNGQAMVRERFSWDAIALAYRRIFNRALERPIRILIATGIFPPDIGGPATYTEMVAQELSRRGYAVRVVTYGDGLNAKIKNQKSKSQFKIQKYPVSVISRSIPKGIRHLCYFLVCVRRAFGVDVVYAQDPVSAGLPALLAAKITGRTFAIRVAGDYAWEQSRQRFGVADSVDEFQRRRYGWRTEFFRRLQRFVVSRADAVITPSDYFRKIVAAWVRDSGKVFCVYNGINLREIACPPDISRAPNMILSAGRLVPWKGFGTLIELMPELSGWQLLIAGDGPERGRLATIAEDLNLADRVTLAGALQEEALLRELCRATVFVLNTSFESFSFQVVQAMAAGCPVITTAIGNLPEIIENGREGILVEPDDRPAILAAIEKVRRDHEFRDRIVANARSRAQVFSIERTTNELLRIFREFPH